MLLRLLAALTKLFTRQARRLCCYERRAVCSLRNGTSLWLQTPLVVELGQWQDPLGKPHGLRGQPTCQQHGALTSFGCEGHWKSSATSKGVGFGPSRLTRCRNSFLETVLYQWQASDQHPRSSFHEEHRCPHPCPGPLKLRPCESLTKQRLATCVFFF